MLSPIFNKIGISILSGIFSIAGMEAIFGPLCKSTNVASSRGNGGSSNCVSTVGLCKGLMVGYLIDNVRGSVISPVKAEAAAVSGLHKYTLSSFVRSEERRVGKECSSLRVRYPCSEKRAGTL